MARLLTISLLLLTLNACAPERRVSWVRPEGVSGRDSIRDRAVCRELSGAREAMLTSGGGGLAGALMDAEAYQIVKRNFASCMTEAGYKPVVH